jgi:hypothetical protein
MFPARFATARAWSRRRNPSPRGLLEGRIGVGLVAGSSHERHAEGVFSGKPRPVTYSRGRTGCSNDHEVTNKIDAMFGDGMRLGLLAGRRGRRRLLRISPAGPIPRPGTSGPRALAFAVRPQDADLAAGVRRGPSGSRRVKGIFGELYLRYFPDGLLLTRTPAADQASVQAFGDEPSPHARWRSQIAGSMFEVGAQAICMMRRFLQPHLHDQPLATSTAAA